MGAPSLMNIKIGGNMKKYGKSSMSSPLEQKFWGHLTRWWLGLGPPHQNIFGPPSSVRAGIYQQLLRTSICAKHRQLRRGANYSPHIPPIVRFGVPILRAPLPPHNTEGKNWGFLLTGGPGGGLSSSILKPYGFP